MDHRPFEDWLLEDKPLSTDEKRQLDSHLRACPSCGALTEVGLALRSVHAAVPAAGFGERFQARLAARQQTLQRRNQWGFLVLTLGVLGLLAWICWPVLEIAVRSPVDLLVSWFSMLVSLWAFVQTVFHAGEVFFRVIPGFIPAFLFPLALFAAAGWSLLWVLSLMKLTRLPQGV